MSMWGFRRVGAGALLRSETGLRLLNMPSEVKAYSNAQIDDHALLARAAFPWRPPVRLGLRARFSHSAEGISGTAGFGFWNDPFAMNGRRPPALPRVAWFFLAGSPSWIEPALGVPGSGWKAAVMDVAAAPFWALLPAAPVAMPLTRFPRVRQALWPIAQRVLGAEETLLSESATEWHDYAIEWEPNRLRFLVDGACVLESRRALRGPLGIVIWMDNQFLVATPQGNFAAGVCPTPATQWMEIADVRVDRSGSALDGL